ncbi:alpha/beta fold hydrolase [Massilia niabensis]|uniref:Alpha/beta fold hydrolase n=1 Tax=Massilia niabensis TaxID=544910 RepID=A0ABW0L658_9BURK
MNQFPNDFPHTLTGFGGDPSLDQAQHRERCKKCPVILVHGNATNSSDPKYGMQAMRTFLKNADYQDCEIWALDYLGEHNTLPVLFGPHRNHIDAFRRFVDEVRDYLDVEKLDFIGHSLGCGMVNGYLRGLQSDGQWNHEDHRLDAAGTFVGIAGATYGLGTGIGSVDEFRTGGPFEVASHRFGDVSSEDTPAGANDRSQQIAPDEAWKVTTSLDDNQVCYVSIIAREDFVDQMHPNTSRRHGADLNKVFNVGSGTTGHERIIKEQAVFDAFKGYLNRQAPVPPVSFSVDKESGNYGANLQVTLTVSPAGATVDYAARRLTRAVQAGYLVETVAEAHEGALSNQQSLTLAHDGAWDVTFTAGSGEPLARTYGVNVLVPELAILTDNGTPFQGSLEVKTMTSKGTVYYSTDKTEWLARSNPIIHETTTLYFIAIDAEGLASPIVSRTYEKKAVEFVKASLAAHFIAGRLDVSGYLDLTRQLGANAVITLYFVNGEWVRDPDVTEVALAPPDISISDEGGVKDAPVTVALAAHHATDSAPTIYYTLDGSPPTRRSPCFTSSGLIRLDSAGTTTLTCRACDAAGHWSDTVTKTYTMECKDGPRISCDKPGGVYPGPIHPMISVPDQAGSGTVVYYTDDGSDPSDPNNPNRKSFVDKKRFTIRGNGTHAILCYMKDSAGHEAFQAFGWQIDDDDYPETRISPSAGGNVVGEVRIELKVCEPCEWTRYTIDNDALDGSEPSDTNGETYTAPIVLAQNARLRFRSKSLSGKLEPVHTATFTVTRQPDRLVFDSDPQCTGYLIAEQGGTILVGTGNMLRIGAVAGSTAGTVPAGSEQPAPHGDSRAILHFDTSSLPDNAGIRHACLEVAFHAKSGDPWSGGRNIEVDVQRGHFGSSRALHAGDWDARATAEGVARIEECSSGTCNSTDFSQAGLDAINKTGITQCRLRMTPPANGGNGACLMLEGGTMARLYVTLASPDQASP